MAKKVYAGELMKLRRFSAGWYVMTIEVAGMMVKVHFDPTTAEQVGGMDEKEDYHAISDVFANRLPKLSKAAKTREGEIA